MPMVDDRGLPAIEKHHCVRPGRGPFSPQFGTCLPPLVSRPTGYSSVMAAGLAGTKNETTRHRHEFAARSEKLDQTDRREIVGRAGVKTGVRTEFFNNRVAQGRFRKNAPRFNHHLNHFVTVDRVVRHGSMLAAAHVAVIDAHQKHRRQKKRPSWRRARWQKNCVDGKFISRTGGEGRRRQGKRDRGAPR